MARQSYPLLHLQDLCVVRGGTLILDHLDWKVESGQHWVILGPNGSGKTSLLSALAGYLTPTAGDCHVLGQTYGECDWRDLRALLGIVSATIASMIPPEEPAFHTVLTGRNGGIALWDIPSKKERAQALALLEEVDAASLADRCWETLSQGEKQRVLIARALIHSPRILILDEPCAGLDPVARHAFLAFVERLIRRSKGPGIALVTHHVEEIVPGFTHALLLKGGRVHASGPLQTTLCSKVLRPLFDSPLLLKRRLGRFELKLPQSGSSRHIL